LRLQDYRDIQARYDRIVSIEMTRRSASVIGALFRDAAQGLTPEGTVVLQPSPSPTTALRISGSPISFRAISSGWCAATSRLSAPRPPVSARTYCARTLRRQLCAHARRLARAFPRGVAGNQRLGFDEKFRRMWEYYCAIAKPAFAMLPSTWHSLSSNDSLKSDLCR